MRWVGRASRARGGWRQHERPRTAAPEARIHPRAPASATSQQPQGLCLDAGYDYDEVRRVAEDFGLTLHVWPRDYRTREVGRCAHKKARRWVVERAHSWHNRFQRILGRWEKREDTWLAMLHLACGVIAWFHRVLPE